MNHVLKHWQIVLFSMLIPFQLTFTMTIFVYLWPFPLFNSMGHLSAVASMPFLPGFLCHSCKASLMRQHWCIQGHTIKLHTEPEESWYSLGSLLFPCVASFPHLNSTILLASSLFFYFGNVGFNGSVSQALLQVIEPNCIRDSVVACHRFLYHKSVFVCAYQLQLVEGMHYWRP